MAGGAQGGGLIGAPPPGDGAPPPGDGAPPPGDGPPPPGDGPPPVNKFSEHSDAHAYSSSSSSSLALAWRSREAVLACARARVVVSSVVVVIDDYNNRKEATRGAIQELAEEAAGLVWTKTPHAAWPALYALAAAAKLLLGDQCLLRSAAAAGERLRDPTAPRIVRTVDFLLGTVRNHLTSVASIDSFASKEEGKTWLSALLYPFEEAVQPWLPPPPKPVSPPVEDLAAQQEAARREAAEDLQRKGTLRNRLKAQSSKPKAPS